MTPNDMLRHHVTGAIERGEAEAITERTTDIGKRVSFWEWDHLGQMTKFHGKIEGEFTDPEEKYSRPSYHVRCDTGQVYTPYADECRFEPEQV